MPNPTGDLLKSITGLTNENRNWMATCKAICAQRLPKIIFDGIPPEVWKFVPWGHRVLVLRTPMVTKHGSIHIPDVAKRENTVGWVLSVGRAITEPDHKLPDIAPLAGITEYASLKQTWGPASDTLHLVGEVVIFSQWAGKPLRTSAYEDTERQLDGNSPLLVLSVGDIWGPYLDLEDHEWASEQPMK